MCLEQYFVCVSLAGCGVSDTNMDLSSLIMIGTNQLIKGKGISGPDAPLCFLSNPAKQLPLI